MKRLIILLTFLVLTCWTTAFCQDFQSYTTSNSAIASNHVSAVAVDVFGRLYIGSAESGLTFVDSGQWATFTTANSDLISNRIKALGCDPDRRLFIGTDVGISMLEGDDWSTFTTDNSPLTDDWIEAIAVDDDGVVWMGTHSGGVCSFHNGSWNVYDTSNCGIASDRVSAISFDADGHLWVGTQDAGVSVRLEAQWQVYDASNSCLTSNRINCIGSCLSGAVWVGTPNGLCVFRDDTSEDHTSLVFDADTRVALVDDFGYRWFGLRTGIVRFDGDSAFDYDSEISNACVISRAVGDGRLYFGTREDGLLEYRYDQNLPPLMPQTPTGPETGSTDTAIQFSTTTTDPERDAVFYQFNWDDGTVSEWGDETQSHTYTALGTYKIIVRAKDIRGNLSGFSEAHALVISVGNKAPQTPAIPNGPTSAYVGETVRFSTSSFDPDGDEIEFMFDWGDGNVSDWGASTRSWVYESVGAFNVKARARDDKGKQSAWSIGAEIVITTPNRPPSQPSRPQGPSSGLVNETCTFSTSSVDPDGDQVSFLFDWGDGADSGWGNASASHAFNRTGIYYVCVLAKDTHGAESIWSQYASIDIGGTPKPIIELGSSRSTYYLGQTIELHGSLINDLDAMDVDVYVAAMLPGSDALLFYPMFSLDPLAIPFYLPAQSEIGPFYFFQYPIVSHIPLGYYTFYGAIVRPGTQYDFLSEIEVLVFEYAGEQ